MELLFLGLTVFVLLYSNYRLQRVRLKTMHLRYPEGDEHTLDYSDEYIQTMNRYFGAPKLRRDDTSPRS